MRRMVLTTETGSDLTQEQAREYGIELVPMHVSFDEETRDDGSFPAEEICAYYDRVKKLPKTSGSTLEDFRRVFDRIHQTWPEARVLHLAYSAVTTVSYSCAKMLAEQRDYVTVMDTRHVSAGLTDIVLMAARELKRRPDLSVEELEAFVDPLRDRVRMCFIPTNLDYLRAGGRCSSVAAWGGKLLNLHPCIEVLNGELKATKKYRGDFNRVIPRLIEEFTIKNRLQTPRLRLIWSPGLSDEHKRLAERFAGERGYTQIEWTKTGGVITTHGGPGCFGMVGLAEE